jgi:hypothetical protein
MNTEQGEAEMREEDGTWTRWAEVLRRLAILAWAASSLGLIGWGLHMIYPPACPLGIGILMWVFIVVPFQGDGNRQGGREKKT